MFRVTVHHWRSRHREPEIWSVDQLRTSEKNKKKKKWIRKTSQSVKVRTGKRLTHAARSCSCSDPGHSQPWWSQSGSTAAPKDIWRSFSVESPQTVSEERKTVSDLLMVRILNQLLSVFQFSYEIVLRGNIKQIRTSKELHPISPLQKQMIYSSKYRVPIFSKSFPAFIFLITSEVRDKQEKGEEAIYMNGGLVLSRYVSVNYVVRQKCVTKFRRSSVDALILTLGLWSSCFMLLSRCSLPLFATKRFVQLHSSRPPESTHSSLIRNTTLLLPRFLNGYFNSPHPCTAESRSFNPHLFLQGGHSLLEVKLQPLVRLWKEFVHSIRQTLVVLLVHLLSLPRLYEEKDHVTSAGKGG